MNISCKVKLKFRIDDRPDHVGNRLYAYIKYKINNQFFSNKLTRILVDDYTNDWIWDRCDKTDIKSIEQVIKECEGVISDMERLKSVIKNEIIEDIKKNHKEKLNKDSLSALENKINNIKFNMNFNIND